jgi:CysZ protein
MVSRAVNPCHNPGMRFHSATAILRALRQLDDPEFLGVIARAVGWTALVFALLHWAAGELIRQWMAGFETLTAYVTVTVWAAHLGVSFLSMWLFVPLAGGIAALYADRIAAAVERRYFPALPPVGAAPWGDQAREAIGIGVGLALMTGFGLLLAVLVPGLGLLLGWLITGYALGRGLFVTVAIRRMDRLAAIRVYQANRWAVLGPGLLIAAAFWLPLANLLAPVIATAAMTHVLYHLAGDDSARA